MTDNTDETPQVKGDPDLAILHLVAGMGIIRRTSRMLHAMKLARAEERARCASIAAAYERAAELNTAAEQQACAKGIREEIEALT